METKNLTRTEKRIHSQQEKVIEFLAESGNISFACKRAGISRETYYRWADTPRFSKKASAAIKLGKSFVNDLAHTQLIRNIQEGDMQAIRFQLANCHPDYKPKLPEHTENFTPVTTIKVDVVDPSVLAAWKKTINDDSTPE
jgi:hypothetical protein